MYPKKDENNVERHEECNRESPFFRS